MGSRSGELYHEQFQARSVGSELVLFRACLVKLRGSTGPLGGEISGGTSLRVEIRGCITLGFNDFRGSEGDFKWIVRHGDDFRISSRTTVPVQGSRSFPVTFPPAFNIPAHETKKKRSLTTALPFVRLRVSLCNREAAKVVLPAFDTSWGFTLIQCALYSFVIPLRLFYFELFTGVSQLLKGGLGDGAQSKDE